MNLFGTCSIRSCGRTLSVSLGSIGRKALESRDQISTMLTLRQVYNPRNCRLWDYIPSHGTLDTELLLIGLAKICSRKLDNTLITRARFGSSAIRLRVLED